MDSRVASAALFEILGRTLTREMSLAAVSCSSYCKYGHMTTTFALSPPRHAQAQSKIHRDKLGINQV